jgi:purine-binding chemotaxis protein CheW
MAERYATGSDPQISGESTKTMVARGGQFLTFQLAGEEYGLEILKVQEIIGLMTVTRVPRTPDFIRGVINLRGKVIPVLDLRLKFGIEGKEDTERTCVIVVQVTQNAAQVTMGMLVDEVSEVLDIGGQQIEPPPSFGTTVETDFIFGMGKIGQKVVMLLDVETILSSSEIGKVDEASVLT